jgi:hypothetical protein
MIFPKGSSPGLISLELERAPDFAEGGVHPGRAKLKAGGHDPNDRDRSFIEPDGAAHQPGIAIERLLKQAVADDGHRRRS